MSLMYYLPEIIFVALAGVVLIWIIFLIRDICRTRKGKATCMYCKAAASNISKYPYLFLIPVFFGHTYEDAEKFLSTNMRPIMGKNQIPSGQRACRVEVYLCPQCDKRQVTITDFLLVRGEEYIKGSYVFAYETFRSLLEEWENNANM